MPTTKFRNGNPVNKVNVNIEIFCAPNCNRCGRAAILVQEVINDIGDNSIHWRQVDVVEEIDYAVSLGIRATPAIIINGILVFTASPAKQVLRKEIEKQL